MDDECASWTSDGCLEEIAARLGYRLLLQSGTFGSSAAPGSKVPYSIQIQNEGYASLVNTRPFQIVLKEINTGGVCAATDASVDVREWYGSATQLVEGNLILPADFPEGTYALFLNLADDSADLRTDLNFKASEFSHLISSCTFNPTLITRQLFMSLSQVKVANTGLNEEGTGMINLQHTVTVAAGEISAPGNTGHDSLVTCGMEHDVLPPVISTGIVKNGGFEGNGLEADWVEYMGGYNIDQTFKHSGYQSIKISDGGARQSVTLNAEAGSQVTIKGYSKAVGTTVGLWDYGIYADVKYEDGSSLWGQIAKFPGGTHDFTLAEKTFVVPTGKTVTGMSLYAMYRNDPISSGVAYFDDVEVTVEVSSS